MLAMNFLPSAYEFLIISILSFATAVLLSITCSRPRASKDTIKKAVSKEKETKPPSAEPVVGPPGIATIPLAVNEPSKKAETIVAVKPEVKHVPAPAKLPSVRESVVNLVLYILIDTFSLLGLKTW